MIQKLLYSFCTCAFNRCDRKNQKKKNQSKPNATTISIWTIVTHGYIITIEVCLHVYIRRTYCIPLPHKHFKSGDYIIITQLHNYYMHRKIAIYVLVILFSFNSYSKLLVPNYKYYFIIHYCIGRRLLYTTQQLEHTLYRYLTTICTTYVIL
jgi:hypothetical protein